MIHLPLEVEHCQARHHHHIQTKPRLLVSKGQSFHSPRLNSSWPSHQQNPQQWCYGREKDTLKIRGRTRMRQMWIRDTDSTRDWREESVGLCYANPRWPWLDEVSLGRNKKRKALDKSGLNGDIISTHSGDKFAELILKKELKEARGLMCQNKFQIINSLLLHLWFLVWESKFIWQMMPWSFGSLSVRVTVSNEHNSKKQLSEIHPPHTPTWKTQLPRGLLSITACTLHLMPL